MRLTDYKVRIIDSTSGTAARTRVLIESSDGTAEWGTVGVNDNIVEASLQALVDSLEYALVRDTSAGSHGGTPVHARAGSRSRRAPRSRRFGRMPGTLVQSIGS